MKKRMLYILACVLVLCTACRSGNKRTTEPSVIADIAYDVNKSWGYTVYLEEGSEYVPFVVVSADYNGGCLLMRECLLDDFVAYNEPGMYGSYYVDSIVDGYLNTIYKQTLSDGVQVLLLPTPIAVTTQNAIDTHEDDTEQVQREVFLLSATETNVVFDGLITTEGELLRYFEDLHNRAARSENGVFDTWWLRTPALVSNNAVIAVADDGSIGVGNINGMDGITDCAVRPCFCIPGDTPIAYKRGIVEDKQVFCLKQHER